MWKTVKNYEKYEVNINGDIRNKKTKKLLKPEICKKWGYLRVRLYFDKKKSKHELVHRIVANTFLDNPNKLPEVNHKDENKTNNCVKNLEWCTSKYNSRYSKGKPVIMISQNRKIRKTFQCIMDAEKCTGINNSSIIRCCKGKQKHAGGFVWRYATWADKKEVSL